jgi:hypothetical protein
LTSRRRPDNRAGLPGKRCGETGKSVLQQKIVVREPRKPVLQQKSLDLQQDKDSGPPAKDFLLQNRVCGAPARPSLQTEKPLRFLAKVVLQ